MHQTFFFLAMQKVVEVTQFMQGDLGRYFQENSRWRTAALVSPGQSEQ
jgi:hypothetical protein